jgi:hypothetical protein
VCGWPGLAQAGPSFVRRPLCRWPETGCRGAGGAYKAAIRPPISFVDFPTGVVQHRDQLGHIGGGKSEQAQWERPGMHDRSANPTVAPILPKRGLTRIPIDCEFPTAAIGYSVDGQFNTVRLQHPRPRRRLTTPNPALIAASHTPRWPAHARPYGRFTTAAGKRPAVPRNGTATAHPMRNAQSCRISNGFRCCDGSKTSRMFSRRPAGARRASIISDTPKPQVMSWMRLVVCLPA